MDHDATVKAVLTHIQDGEIQHPETKPIEAYPELINAWATLIFKARQVTDPGKARAEAGRRFLQLAGLCIRAVSELQLPLTVPDEPA